MTELNGEKGVKINRLPQDYKDFGNLLGRQNSIVETLNRFGPIRAYEEAFIHLCQLMDRSDYNRFHGNLDNLEPVSAYTCQQKIRKDPLLQADVARGHQGVPLISRRNIDMGIRQSFDGLPDHLLNTHLVADITSGGLSSVLENEQQVCKECGVQPDDPVYQIVMIERLRAAARNHMLDPLIKIMKRYADTNPIKYAIKDDAGIIDAKTNILMGALKQTEYYRGLTESLQSKLGDIYITLTDAGQDAEAACLLAEALAFMRSSHASGTNSKTLKSRIIEKIAQHDYDGAKKVVQELMVKYPNLWFPSTQEKFGIVEN
ncbi:hypothetical protein A2631_02310 [Candidatus Daviesbacteria bacterium RIFCSPHIGHO2_01_FULL_44_29]|uniref:Uncharacterized protein n=1 Tax=Candidatus Daviesbacteria bacterium RIFCSPHIGHO2_02_FULL_43_12 TaxID=1797776 RepID=A0A1F5KKA9_9BACT|nr:MAG: hypothetical protein A2631_02310 [Candidatus Daviesbacteria bacterium RIFCSPHIGHO2_01_FULL_44_29]OGE40990.1 MAG: hypothetical protein A3E86_03645 [Candidatus Daviesbacteria bacterium RIFCSPHIGHO2_12_FULL_47_45]OGE41225.1 MAG: hypothetical protein A3D25_01705 [Candidatus Daviesbacteria bacterium RIFCSPHIGHO2_02_FULL_43_12]OGE69425.1 MAG: hypothetical protein A3B55_03445 [Candidatus Daviesbacteria bacterium RIFCSPLOWO2_01_FULL_43_15]